MSSNSNSGVQSELASMLKDAVREVIQELQTPYNASFVQFPVPATFPLFPLPLLGSWLPPPVPYQPAMPSPPVATPPSLPFVPAVSEKDSQIKVECRKALESIINKIETSEIEANIVSTTTLVYNGTPSLSYDSPAYDEVKATTKPPRDDRPFEILMSANTPDGFPTFAEAKEALRQSCSDSGFFVEVGTTSRLIDKNWFKNFQCCDNGSGNNRLCPVRYRIFLVKSSGRYFIQKKTGGQLPHNHPPINRDTRKRRGLPGWLTRQMAEVIESSELLGNKVEPDQMRRLLLQQHMYNSELVNQSTKRLHEQINNAIGYWIHNRTQRLIEEQ